MTEAAVPNLLAHPFRPFFLLTGLYGVIAVMAWIAFLFGGWPLPLGWSPLQWHSHEMLYGFVVAAAAGFMLTAMVNWTGATPLRGGGLLALVALWLSGRAVMWFAGWLPPWLVALVDLCFLPVLAVYVARVLLRHQNRRNLALVAVLMLLAMGNLMMHIGFVTGRTYWLQLGQLHGFDTITLLMILIAGRITPAFTKNWLRRQGRNPEAVRQFTWIDRLSVASVVLLLPLGWCNAPPAAVGCAALFAGTVNLLRLIGWSGWRAASEPLLWILHLAYLWIVVALLLRGISLFSDGIPATAWLHALGVGAMGTLILGVMTRVAMGHTGRPLKLLPFAFFIYVAILAAALLRVLAAVQLVDYTVGVNLAALCWVLAFGLFVILYGPVLSSRRADGHLG